MKWSDAARGRFAIFLGLTWDERFLLDLCRESRLAGDFGDVVPYQIMTFGVEAFVAEASIHPGRDCRVCPPWGVRPHLLSAPAEDRV